LLPLPVAPEERPSRRGRAQVAAEGPCVGQRPRPDPEEVGERVEQAAREAGRLELAGLQALEVSLGAPGLRLAEPEGPGQPRRELGDGEAPALS
jgi:hypothetical protein